jgi:hypothetical protein
MCWHFFKNELFIGGANSKVYRWDASLAHLEELPLEIDGAVSGLYVFATQ